MLNQAKHWIEIGGAAVDALLVLRILQLRLYRTYTFITLACVLSLFSDGVAIWLGPSSREFTMFFFYSRFLYAFVFPAAVYDVWEEAKSTVERIRRAAAVRLVSSLVLAAVLGLLIAGFAASDDPNPHATLATFAVILWAATSTASFAFLWATKRMVRAGKFELPKNTPVWLQFFQLVLAGEVVDCFLIIMGQQYSETAATAIDIGLALYSLTITVWCIWKLRPTVSNVPSAPENSITS